MRTPRLPVIDWTGPHTVWNWLDRFAERQNVVSAHAPSHLKRSLPPSSGNIRKHTRGHHHHILHHKKYYLNNRQEFLRSIINSNFRTSKWHVALTSWNCSSTMSLLETWELQSVVLVMVGQSNSMPNFATIGQIIQKLKRAQTHHAHLFPLWEKVWGKFKITKLSVHLTSYLQTDQLAINLLVSELFFFNFSTHCI